MSHSDDWDRGYAAGFDNAEAMYAQQREDDDTLRTLDDLRKLTPEQCLKRKAEVDAVLEGRV